MCEKQLLFILDNCEHLIEASAEVVDEFLQVAAIIKILASSREAQREEYEKEVTELKANMDREEFTSLWIEGRSMTMDEVIELALEEYE